MKPVLKSLLLSMVFVSNLSLGSTGPDVVNLQQFLVAKGYLAMPAGVAYGYFGPLTKAAVAKWQAAMGISPATGFFGPISRAAIARETTVAAPAPVPTPAPPPTPAPASPTPFTPIESDTPYALGMRANRVMLFRALPYEVRPGGEITLDGSGFSKTLNKVFFNDSNAVTATSTDGVVLRVRVPSNLSLGEYQLSVMNVLGSSDPNIQVFIKVTNNPHPGPMIESASISGDIVTVVGSGFTSSNNIYSTFGNSSGPVSSGGTTLTFSLSNLSLYGEIKESISGFKYMTELLIYVQNEHGTSKEPYKLEIII